MRDTQPCNNECLSHRSQYREPLPTLTNSVIVPTHIDNFEPSYERPSTAQELTLLELSCGDRKCSGSVLDRLLNFYLLAIVAVVLFIILSLKVVDDALTEIIPSHVQRLIFKAFIVFIVVFLIDRWITSWRTRHVICHHGL